MSGRGHQDIPASAMEWRDGTADGIKYARFRMDEADDHSPTIILTKFGPGAEVPPHTHDTNYFEYILEGQQTVDKTSFGPGDVRIVKSGTGHGPIKVGPQGCTVMIVFQDGSRSNTVALPRVKVAAGV